MVICQNPYNVSLHAKPAGCQMCIFKLSESEKELYEKNGRHLRVAMTTGGCDCCLVFPSEEGEDPVRLCKKCFFDTHLLPVRKEKAFEGTGALSGVQIDKRTYNPTTFRFYGGRIKRR